MGRQYLLIAATRATAPEVRVLADSLALSDPTVPRTIVVIDEDPRSLELLDDAGEIRTATDLGLDPDLVGRWVGAYGERGLIWAAFPHVLSSIGDPGDHVLWIGADVAVVQAPAPFWAALEESDVVAGIAAPLLAPNGHAQGESANDRPYALQSASAVTRHDGKLISRSLLGWTVGSRTVTSVLSEWPVPQDFPAHESLATSATAQLWFNALALSDEVALVRSAGSLLSTAQLISRTFDPGSTDTSPLVDDQPLTLLRLRGFDVRQPYFLDDEIATAVSEQLPLAPLLRQRAAALMAAGWTRANESDLTDETPRGTRWDVLPEGLPHNEMTQRLIRDGLRDGTITHSPFTEAGFDQLRTYALQPAGQGGSVGVTRLLAAILAVRSDVRAAFPSLDGNDGLAFIEWAWNSGRQEMSIPKSFLPPRPNFVEAAAKKSPSRRRPDTEGVNLAGHFTSGIGVGESMRQIAAALEAAGVPTTLVQGLFVPSTRQQAEFSPVGPQDAHHDVNIVVANGYQMPALVHDVGKGFFVERPTIGIWWWEVDPFPGAEWAPALKWLDELWVGTDFIRDLIEPHVDVPVWVYPVPVSVQRQESPLDRAHFDWEDDETVFLYIWDYRSTEARKNPSGLVEAYRRAFPEESGSKTRLVLKCINHESVPEVDKKVRRAAAGRSDIVFIDRFLGNREKNALLELCDCYVSPHRSEGFGYAPAEAMLLSKPVVLTGYGGTTQYADDTVARIVKWTPAKVGPGAWPYPPDGRWADPDLDDLAAALRWIVEQPEAAAAMAERGWRRVTERHNAVVSGTAMRERLDLVRARGAGSRPSTVEPAARRIARRLARNRLTGPPLRALRRKWRSLMDNAVASRTADLNNHVAALQQRVDVATEKLEQEARARQTLTARIEDDIKRLAGRFDQQLAKLKQRDDEVERRVDVVEQTQADRADE